MDKSRHIELLKQEESRRLQKIKEEQSQVYAIIGIPDGDSKTHMESTLAVKGVVFELSDAKHEVERLNRGYSSKGLHYIWKPTSLKPRRIKPMLQKEAREMILKEWRKSRPSNPHGNDMFAFFCELAGTMPELTGFRTAGDPWQVIHAWLAIEEDAGHNST